MKHIATRTIWYIVAGVFASGASAGEIAKGKICDFNIKGFIPDAYAPGTYGGGSKMECSKVVVGAETRDFRSKVRVLDIGAPPYIIPGCERGREHSVLVEPIGGYGSDWTYPRYLNCP